MAENQVVNLGMEKMTAKMEPTMSKGWTQAVSLIQRQSFVKRAPMAFRMFIDIRRGKWPV